MLHLNVCTASDIYKKSQPLFCKKHDKLSNIFFPFFRNMCMMMYFYIILYICSN
jgi:hypothetical protein